MSKQPKPAPEDKAKVEAFRRHLAGLKTDKPIKQKMDEARTKLARRK